MYIRGRIFAPALALILSSLACGPSDSALIVSVPNWPADAVKLRLLLTFDGKPGQTMTVEPGTPQFSVVVPTGQPGKVVVEGMIRDSAKCYTAGKLITADFAGNQGPQIQNVELRLSPYAMKACPVSPPMPFMDLFMGRYPRLWGDRPDNYWLPIPSANAILRWDGAAWISMNVSAATFGAWGTSSGEAWAGNTTHDMMHWDGSMWTLISAPPFLSAGSFWGSGGSDIWAVGALGNSGIIEHWDGTSWEMAALPPSPSSIRLEWIWGSSSSDVWAVGFDATNSSIILHWDGTAWKVSQSPPSRLARSVWGSSSSDVWVAAQTSNGSGQILHWDGTGWSVSPSPSLIVSSVWGSNSSDVWAVGDSGFLRWNGNFWAASSSPIPIVLHSVWGSSSSDVWALGSTSANLVTALHWDGTTWSSVF